MPLQVEPIEIEYKRWRSKSQSYEVIVLQVHHRQSLQGYVSTVYVRGSRHDPDKQVSWPAPVFLRSFEPLGRKLRIPTRWERLKKD